jgi:hypothetical protein
MPDLGDEARYILERLPGFRAAALADGDTVLEAVTRTHDPARQERRLICLTLLEHAVVQFLEGAADLAIEQRKEPVHPTLLPNVFTLGAIIEALHVEERDAVPPSAS